MTRFKLTVEYDGSPFVGWQQQANGRSIQAAIEEAVRRFCGETVRIQGAGRTDAGVHATGQVAHLDLDRPTTPETLRDAVNFHLRPDPIAILEAEPVGPEFHARFSARGRAYLYRIVNRKSPLALDHGRAWRIAGELDAEAMDEAAQLLVGRHDFSSFRAALCQAESAVKTLDHLSAERRGAEILIRAEARSFLHHQVRNMVGSLKLVGLGRWSKAEFSSALAARDRSAAGETAPADGLYLTRVWY